MLRRHDVATSSGQQVLWGYKRQVKGSNGRSSAQLVRPRGSTLTFQLNAGVSWVHGLRHGVAMHPRGRHLREDRTLLFTWESQHRSVNSSHHNNHNNNHNHYHNHNHDATKNFGGKAMVQNAEGQCQETKQVVNCERGGKLKGIALVEWFEKIHGNDY